MLSVTAVSTDWRQLPNSQEWKRITHVYVYNVRHRCVYVHSVWDGLPDSHPPTLEVRASSVLNCSGGSAAQDGGPVLPPTIVIKVRRASAGRAQTRKSPNGGHVDQPGGLCPVWGSDEDRGGVDPRPRLEIAPPFPESS